MKTPRKYHIRVMSYSEDKPHGADRLVSSAEFPDTLTDEQLEQIAPNTVKMMIRELRKKANETF